MQKCRIGICLSCILLLFACSITKQKSNFLLLNDFYPIADQNEWRYTAPEGWKDGDYISKIEKEVEHFSTELSSWEVIEDSIKNETRIISPTHSFKHFDATKAGKMLQINQKGLFYIGEIFSGEKSFVLFDQPILWFPHKFKIGTSLSAKRGFTRFYIDGKITRGTFSITQKIVGQETVTVPAGTFDSCLRIEFDTYWDFGKGSEAKSINVYHHAKAVGVVKASARFILLRDGKELLNRLVEPDLKKYTLY